MKKALFSLLLALASFGGAWAQKKLYIPWEWRNSTSLYKENDPDNKATYSKSRSKESDNFIVYWQNGYGNTNPSAAPSTYRVDIDDLLEKAETFYALNVGKLAFCDEKNSKVSQYKMIICLLHDDGWTATGSGYDNTVGALWITPSTCKPVGHTIAHEIGHSFQYQCFSDLGGYAGFRTAIGNGSTFWEQTAQWQAAQAYPGEKWSQSWALFHSNANYAMTHEWMRYQSYWWHYYLAEQYGIDFIGKLWRHDTGKGQDPNEVLMSLAKWDVTELYRQYFLYALKMATLDLGVDNIRKEAAPYIGDYTYNAIPVAPHTYQVAYSSTPQATGFNVIPLDVPAAGTVISTDFTSLKSNSKLAEGDPVEYHNGDRFVTLSGKSAYNSNSKYNSHRGFRLGYVALLKDGTRQYIYEDSLYCAEGGVGDKTVTLTATVPENVDRMWLVVSPAPRAYYQHKWDEAIANDDQWPYTVAFTGTDLKNAPGFPTLNDALPVTDATITLDVQLPFRNDYNTVDVTLSGDAAALLGTAFQMMPSAVASHLVGWRSGGPTDGQVMFYAVDATTGNLTNQGSNTNATYGHWFSDKGVRTNWGTTTHLYSDFTPGSLTFAIGQYPGHTKVGNTYTIGQALRYRRGDETATVKIMFNVTIVSASTAASYTVGGLEESPLIDEILTGIDAPALAPGHAAAASNAAVYSLGGARLAAPQKGINIIRYPDGTTRKVMAR